MTMKNTRTNTHTLSGIQTHGLGVQAIKAYASDRAATGIEGGGGVGWRVDCNALGRDPWVFGGPRLYIPSVTELHTYTDISPVTRTLPCPLFQHNVLIVALGGIVVIVLDIGLNVHGFNPGRGQWIFKDGKAEARVRARVNPFWIYGGQSGNGTGLSPSSSVFPCQYIIPPSFSKLISSGERVIC
jgi:hypothetical protein